MSHDDTRLCPSRPLMRRSRRRLVKVEGRQEGGSGASGAGVGERKREGAEGVREMSDRWVALDVALRA